MRDRESYLPPQGHSLRALRRARVLERRQHVERTQAEQQQAVSLLKEKLAQVNEGPAFRQQYEIVTPITRTSRLFHPLRRSHTIPAETSHESGKSTMGGWVNYRKVTGRYLLVEPAIGYPIREDDEGSTTVLFVDGRMGRIMPQLGLGRYSYNRHDEGQVVLGNGDNDFKKRQCEPIWGRDIRSIEALSRFDAQEATKALSDLAVG